MDPQSRQQSVTDEEDGTNDLIECTGKGHETDLWRGYLPGSRREFQRNSWRGDSLVDSVQLRNWSKSDHRVRQVEEVRTTIAQNHNQVSSGIASLFNADTNKQNGRRNKVRIFGVKENANEDVYQEVNNVVRASGVEIDNTDFSSCHRIPNKIHKT